MNKYYESLNMFAETLRQKCDSLWEEECVVVAACGVYAEFETYKKQNSNPYVNCEHSLLFWTEYLNRMRDVKNYYKLGNKIYYDKKEKSKEDVHLELYGQIWPVFGKKTLEEIKAIIKKRLKDNKLDKEFFKDKSVIDLGCGGGRFSFVAHDLGARKVLGIDFNERNIESAKKWVSESGLSNIEFHVGSVYETGEPEGSYDVAISNGVFHILEKPQDAYNESARILKEDGKLFLYVEAK
jgi:SAM-dependent methyltransferase